MRQWACLGWLVLAASLNAAACGRTAHGERRGPEKAAPESQTSDDAAAGDDDSPGASDDEPSLSMSDDEPSVSAADDDSAVVHKSNREWRRILSTRQYRVTRLKETEEPGSGKYAHSKEPGTYHCVCCGAELFESKAKFESGTGWPSFFKPADEKYIKTALDVSAPELRIEVSCGRCDAHLGHVFSDGPPPTGLRFCINSASLDLVPAGQQPRIGKKADAPRNKSKKTRRPKAADDATVELPQVE